MISCTEHKFYIFSKFLCIDHAVANANADTEISKCPFLCLLDDSRN